MAKPDKLVFLLNGAGALVFASLAGFVLVPLFSGGEEPGCFARYERAAVFGFADETGAPRTPIELQAEAGWSERGMLHKVTVQPNEGGPAPAVLEVALGGTADDDERAIEPALSFDWRPRGLPGATAACLRYQVHLPEDFDFRRAGVLPSLFGGERQEFGHKADASKGVSARLMWRGKGAGEINAVFAGAAQRQGQILGYDLFKLKPGKWISIEQEVVLDTPGAADGALRVWVDGDLSYQSKAMAWRGEAPLSLDGVLADVGYARSPGVGDNKASSGGSTSIRISPLEVAW